VTCLIAPQNILHSSSDEKVSTGLDLSEPYHRTTAGIANQVPGAVGTQISNDLPFLLHVFELITKILIDDYHFATAASLNVCSKEIHELTGRIL
jgi:hypothetical protein